VDFDMITTLAPTSAGEVLRLARPADATRKTTLCGRPPRRADGEDWADDACRYCKFRPQAAEGTAEADRSHPNNYQYGVGSGAHNPRSCQAMKRWLAEGGGPSVSADLRAYIQSCLIKALPGAGRGYQNRQ
jgi:hypothetical protein